MAVRAAVGLIFPPPLHSDVATRLASVLGAAFQVRGRVALGRRGLEGAVYFPADSPDGTLLVTSAASRGKRGTGLRRIFGPLSDPS